MDRHQARSAGLISLVFAAVTLVAATTAVPMLRAVAWLAPGQRLVALESKPPECLAPAADEADAGLIAIGRTAFRSPSLLGGQAAMAGMSCETCHANGRRNDAFHFAGLSGDAGTADVTSSMMSSHRGNGVFDPRRIPDLAYPAKISRDPASPALRVFVQGLITQEFDGDDPPPLAFKGLLAYVRAVRPCPSEARVPIDVSSAMQDVDIAIAAARGALVAGDRRSARLMLTGARHMLGLIDERYAVPGLDPLRVRLRTEDHRLLLLEQAVDAGQSAIDRRFADARPSEALKADLRRAEPRSLYASAILARRLAEP